MFAWCKHTVGVDIEHNNPSETGLAHDPFQLGWQNGSAYQSWQIPPFQALQQHHQQTKSENGHESSPYSSTISLHLVPLIVSRVGWATSPSSLPELLSELRSMSSTSFTIVTYNKCTIVTQPG